MSNTLQILAATEKRLAQAVDTAQQLRGQLAKADQAARAEKERADKAEAELAVLRETLRDANRVLIHHHLANYVVEDVCSICESSRIFYKIDAALADAGKGK